MFEGDLIVFESDSDNNDGDDYEDYGQTFTAHLSKVELNEQLSTTLESIASSRTESVTLLNYPTCCYYFIIG